MNTISPAYMLPKRRSASEIGLAMNGITALPFSAWPIGRKVAAGLFALGSYVALACAAVYLAGVLFLVLNKANPRQAQWTSIAQYWQLYADDAALRKKLVASMAVSGLGLLVLLLTPHPPAAQAAGGGVRTGSQR